MKIEMRTLQAGPKGIRRPGQRYEVTAQVGKELIEAGAAVQVEDDNKPAVEIERAVETGKAETATAPAAKRTTKKRG